MLLQPLFGRRGDRLKLGDETRRRVARLTVFARHGFRTLGEARQVGASLTAVAEHSGGQQAAEPGRVLQRLDRNPGFTGDRGSEGRR